MQMVPLDTDYITYYNQENMVYFEFFIHNIIIHFIRKALRCLHLKIMYCE